mmetsp:Transcript_25852/g.74500  ORF Transcript_25852/g.74500 Transcript_25852/m.74500 type:complete len:511 (+) Transcript_25852:352-1884(+)
MPQLSSTVSGRDVGKRAPMRMLISKRPRRKTAALVFAARPKPSQNPAARATTFFRPPKSSTPKTSGVERTEKLGQLNNRQSSTLCSSREQPNVASAKFPVATSFATFAPLSTAHSGILKRSAMTWLPVFKVFPPSSTTMWPFTSDTAMVPGLTTGAILSSKLSKNWCGNTKTRMFAPLTASTGSGSATMLVGRSKPGRYLTFWCSVLMISVSFLPSTISSCTHMLTEFLKSGNLLTLTPTIRAMAVPQLPEPRTTTFCASERRTRGKVMLVRLSGGSSRVMTRCSLVMKGKSISTCSLRTKVMTSWMMLMPVGMRGSDKLFTATCSQLKVGSSAKTFAHFRFRESPKLDTIMSVQPQASWRASAEACCGKNRTANLLISTAPNRTMADLVLKPYPTPSQMPPARETIVFKTAKSSTDSVVLSALTEKLGLLKRLKSKLVCMGSAQPKVASAKLPAATSPARVPPIRTATGMPSFSDTTWLPNFNELSPTSNKSFDMTSAIAVFFTEPEIS